MLPDCPSLVYAPHLRKQGVGDAADGASRQLIQGALAEVRQCIVQQADDRQHAVGATTTLCRCSHAGGPRLDHLQEGRMCGASM